MDRVIGQRVLGGVVLVAAAVLFLPMVLEGAGVAALQPPEIPAKPTVPTAGDLAPALQDQAATLETDIAESHGEPTFYPVQPATRAAPEATEAVPERFRLAEPEVAPPPEAKPVAEPTPAPKAVTKSASKPKAKPAPEPKAKPVPELKAKSLPDAWVVQVASLSSKASADDLVARLRERGFRAAATNINGAYKISVGPELDRAIAESLKERLRNDSELKLNGFILPYRP